MKELSFTFVLVFSFNLGLIILVSPSISFSQDFAQTTKEEPAEHGPYICHGLLDYGGFQIWGLPLLNEEHIACPKGWAVYSTHSMGSRTYASAEDVAVYPQCCKLPSDDILIDEHLQVSAECPENFVVTGITALDSDDEAKPRRLRCTRINTERYQLGAASKSLFWGYSFGSWKHKQRIMKMDIPAAIRYGAGRMKQNSYFFAGCIGYPFGSLFFKKNGKRCYEHYYKQLQFKGVPGDPTPGTPVTMFPECVDISDPFDPQSRCIKE